MKKIWNGIFEFIMRAILFAWIAYCIWSWIIILERGFPTGC